MVCTTFLPGSPCVFEIVIHAFFSNSSCISFSCQDTGPQMPTNVSAMLKYGPNLLQAVGQFNGKLV